MDLLLLIASLAIPAFFIIVRRLKNTRITRQARLLKQLLARRHIQSQLEYWDGAKHIDLFVPVARLNIEVDGSQHFLDPNQVISDMKRTCASCRHAAYTFHVPNIILEKYADELADTIAEVVRKLPAQS